MLLNYQQFLLRQAIRSPMYLSDPRVVLSFDVSLPRQSVVHYLNYNDTSAFPTRQLYYLNGIQESKRVPTQHITALNRAVDVTVIQNRTLAKQIQTWKNDNNKYFKAMDLLVTPNLDTQTHALINYQNLKSLYAYKSSAIAELNRYRNVYQTYWECVHKAIEVDPTAQQFVHIALPSLIPSKGLLDNLLKTPDATYARVAHSSELKGVIDLYMYLNKATRDKSTMKSITEEDSSKVTVELTYQGYSCFFNLSFLLSLADDSTLASKRKLTQDQLSRLYLLIVLKIQKKVYELVSGEAQPEVEQTLDVNPDEHLETDEDSDDEPQINQATSVGAPTLSQAVNTAKSSEEQEDKIVQSLTGLTDGVELEMSELEGDSDDIFARLMSQAAAPVEPVEAATSGEESTGDTGPALALNYSPERQAQLLTSKTLDENLQDYIATAKASGSVSPAEIRSLKKVFEERKTMKSPYGKGLIDEHKVVTSEDVTFTAEDTKLDIKNNLVDDELKTEVLFNFDRMYVNKLLQKDILGCVTQIEQAGIVIKSYEVEQNDSALGSYEMHKLTIKPYKGKESTVYFRIPVINEEGEFRASGIDYRMRKQRQD